MIDLTTIKLVGFDVDGTLVETQSGKKFRENAADWKILPGRVAKIFELKEQGKRQFVASNQGGVAFGYLKQEEIMLEIHKLAKMLTILPGGVYICYNHPHPNALEQYRHEDIRRKPGPGMLLETISDFSCTAEETLFVGDRDEDREAASAAGCHFMWAWEFFGEDEQA